MPDHSAMAALWLRRHPFRVSLFSIVAIASFCGACSSSSVGINTPSSTKCAVTVTNSLQTVPPSGASGTLTVATNRDCTWAASSGVAWIVITGGSSGQGDGSVAYRVAANTDSSSRRGAIDVNSAQVTIAQDAACRFEVSASSTTVSAEGGSVTVNVQSGGTCGWTAASQSDWIAVANGSSGTGDGVATLSVSPNHGAARNGHVTVAGQSITIAQAGTLPGPPTCNLSINPTSQTVAAGGGTGVVMVNVAAGCAWTATSGAPWLTIASGTNGNGAGEVHYSAAANPGTASRQAVLTIGGQTLTVAQAGVSCTYALQPTSQNVAASGSAVSVTVSAPAACPWPVHSNATWIVVTSANQGTGNGTVTVNVAANNEGARSGTVSIGDQTFTITQAAAACSYAVAPASQSFGAAGGNGAATVTVAGGGPCTWTGTSNASWISITSGASGTGNGTVSFTVAANNGGTRTGTLTIAGQTLTVTQTAISCSFSLASTTQTFSENGGQGSVAVAASDQACTWTASSGVSWITISGSASFTGNGTVAFTVALNSGSGRTGTLTIAGQPFTVTQSAAPCSYAFAPTSQSFADPGGNGTFNITTGATCAWSATATVSWIAITSAASGTGSAAVAFSVAANTGPDRTGTITAGGQTFTVTQTAPAPCTFSVAPSATTFPAEGGNGGATVTASGASCAWTATSADGWLSITGGASGTGSGSVTFSLAPNSGSQRSTTLTVAGQAITITQAGGS